MPIGLQATVWSLHVSAAAAICRSESISILVIQSDVSHYNTHATQRSAVLNEMKSI